MHSSVKGDGRPWAQQAYLWKEAISSQSMVWGGAPGGNSIPVIYWVQQTRPMSLVCTTGWRGHGHAPAKSVSSTPI